MLGSWFPYWSPAHAPIAITFFCFIFPSKKRLTTKRGRKSTEFHLCFLPEAVLVDVHNNQMLNFQEAVCAVPHLQHEQNCLEGGKFPSKLLSMYPEALYLQPWHYKNTYFHSKRQIEKGAVFLALTSNKKIGDLTSFETLPVRVSTSRELKLHVAPHHIYKNPCTVCRG